MFVRSRSNQCLARPRSACVSPKCVKPYVPTRLLSREDPYMANQIGRKMEKLKIAQRCMKRNRESVCLFYTDLIMKTTRPSPPPGRILRRPASAILIKPKQIQPDLKPNQKKESEMDEDEGVKEENQALAQLEEIRETRIDFANFLITNRKSHIRLKDLRNMQYLKPFESKEPFLSLNAKLLGKRTKFSRLKTYTIIINSPS